MPPKKRGRPTKKTVDAADASQGESLAPSPKKRGRPAKKAPDATRAAVSEDDIAPPPTKKAKGKQATKGKKAADPVVASHEDRAPAVPTQAAEGKQPAKDDDQSQPKANGLFQNPIKKQQKDAQIARTEHLAVPVDEHCPLSGESALPIWAADNHSFSSL
jgi:hypothetical protein